MSNDNNQSSLLKMIIVAGISFGGLLFLFYLAGAALEGIGNALAAIPWWVYLIVIILVLYVLYNKD